MSNVNPKTRKQKTVLLVETAMLTAIIAVMAFTPLGYLRVDLGTDADYGSRNHWRSYLRLRQSALF